MQLQMAAKPSVLRWHLANTNECGLQSSSSVCQITIVFFAFAFVFVQQRIYLLTACDRVEAQEKMISLRDRADKDVQQHMAEMKELIRVIDQDRRLREFMNAKSKEREEDRQLVAWRQRKGSSALCRLSSEIHFLNFSCFLDCAI